MSNSIERNPVMGLGVYMRNIARRLTDDQPMDAAHAYRVIRYTDEGYASATLIRLRERGIALEIGDGQFVRGPRWKEAAHYYRWENADAAG